MKKLFAITLFVFAVGFSTKTSAQEVKLRANIESFDWETKTVVFGPSFNPETKEKFESVTAKFTDKVQIKVAGKKIKAEEFNNYMDQIKKRGSVLFEAKGFKEGKYFVKRMYFDNK